MLIFVWTQFFTQFWQKNFFNHLFFNCGILFTPSAPPHNGLLLFNGSYRRPITSSIRAGLFSPAPVSDSLPPLSSRCVRVRALRIRTHVRTSLRKDAHWGAVVAGFWPFFLVSGHCVGVARESIAPPDWSSQRGSAGTKIEPRPPFSKALRSFKNFNAVRAPIGRRQSKIFHVHQIYR